MQPGRAWSDLADANTLIRASAYAAFAVGFLVIALEVLKRGGGAWATSLTSLFLAFLLTTATWIWPWYILWALGFAALSPSSRAVRLTLILTASSLLIYPLFSYQGTDMWWGFNFRGAGVGVPGDRLVGERKSSESRNRHRGIPLGTLGEFYGIGRFRVCEAAPARERLYVRKEPHCSGYNCAAPCGSRDIS